MKAFPGPASSTSEWLLFLARFCLAPRMHTEAIPKWKRIGTRGLKRGLASAVQANMKKTNWLENRGNVSTEKILSLMPSLALAGADAPSSFTCMETRLQVRK